MRKLIASLFMTLDGVVEAPGSGDTTLPEFRGWTEPFMTNEIGSMIFSQMEANDTMLLGRKTHEGFVAFWPAVPESDPFGGKMNGTRKVVVSKTLQKAEWKNSTILKGDFAEGITNLKQEAGKNIAVVGSGTLVNSLIQADLLDELQLLVFPVVLGVGKRLFPEAQQKTLKLIANRAFSSGVVMLTYGPVTKG